MSQMYNTKTFVDVYEDVDAFKDDYEDMTSFQSNELTTNDITRIYYMLYAKYGNSPISNLDENQFKYKLFMTIWQYAPTWLKRIDIQGKLRSITDDDLIKGAKAVHNHAFNPSTEPSTASLEELTYINDQNTTSYKKSKMDAYGQLWSILVSDVTEEFMARFKPLFQKAVNLKPYLFESED